MATIVTDGLEADVEDRLHRRDRRAAPRQFAMRNIQHPADEGIGVVDPWSGKRRERAVGTVRACATTSTVTKRRSLPGCRLGVERHKKS